MRFLIFSLDTFIITVIANGVVEWRHRYHVSKGYIQMLYTCGIWLGFMYGLQFLKDYFPQYTNLLLGLPILIALCIGPAYIKHKMKHVKLKR